MALESIGKQFSGTNSLYRPIPMTKMQQNLSQFYERTSSFVDDQFKGMVGADESLNDSNRKIGSSYDFEDDTPRLNPKGIGQRVDMYV